MPASTTPTTIATFAPYSHSLHTQEFVMIPNPRYMKSGYQPLFPPQSSPPLGGEARTSPVPGSTPSPISSQPGSYGTHTFLSTPSQDSMNQHVEFKFDGKSWYVISNLNLL